MFVNLFLAVLSNKTVFDDSAAKSKNMLRISTIVVNIYLKTMNCKASGEYPTIALITAAFEIYV